MSTRRAPGGHSASSSGGTSEPAYRHTGDAAMRSRAAQRDQVRRAGAGADEVHRHGLATVQMVTGMAGRQPVNPPTGAARCHATAGSARRRAGARAGRGPPSDSRVTALATSRPPAGQRRPAALRSTPSAVTPPPTKTASGVGRPVQRVGGPACRRPAAPGTPSASALAAMRAARAGSGSDRHGPAGRVARSHSMAIVPRPRRRPTAARRAAARAAPG